jgi:hypothetical protein
MHQVRPRHIQGALETSNVMVHGTLVPSVGKQVAFLAP